MGPIAPKHPVPRALLEREPGRRPRPILCRDLDEARFVDRTRLSPLGPRTGVFLTVDAATDAQTQQRVVLKRAPDGMAIHLANDLLPNLLNVSGAHVMTATACFDGGATRVATYERMDGSLVQLLLATNGTDPLFRFVPPRRDRACFALTAVHQMLRGLAAAHAVPITNTKSIFIQQRARGAFYAGRILILSVSFASSGSGMGCLAIVQGMYELVYRRYRY